jgi:hypothetical protein
MGLEDLWLGRMWVEHIQLSSLMKRGLASLQRL